MGFFNRMSEPVFLKKDSGLKEQLEKLKSLEPLLNEEGRAKLKQDIRNLEAGILGERNIAFELENSHMPMYVIHNLYLRDGDLTSQIDYLVVTRKICFIIECKNLYGNIEIDNQGTFVRTMEFGKQRRKEGIYSPITQNQRHMALLRKLRLEQSKGFLSRFLRDRSFDEDHRAIVVLANPRTVLDARYAKKEVKSQVIRADHLVDYIRETCQDSRAAELSDKEMLNWANSYLDMDQENEVDYLKKYEGYKAVKVREEAGKARGNGNYGSLTGGNGNRGSRNGENGNYGSQNPGNRSYGSQNPGNRSYGSQNPGNRSYKSPNPGNRSYGSPNPGNGNYGTGNPENRNYGTRDENGRINGGLHEEDRESIIKELRSYRWNTSQAEGLKPYMVFNDRQMMDLLEKFPADGQELKNVFGFGDVKVEKYGTEIIGILDKYRAKLR